MSTSAVATTMPSIDESSIERGLTRGTQIMVALLLASMVIVIWISVFTRYVMNDPISWGEQVAKYLMIWAAFLGASIGIREGSHIAVNVLVDMLPRVLQRVVAVIVLLITVSFLGGCVYFGVNFAIKVSGHTDPMVGEMSMAWPYSAIPVGCVLMLVQLYYVTRRGWDQHLSRGPSLLS